MARDSDIEDPPGAINPYEVLEVEEKATADAIKSAYRKKALRHHPDKAPPEAKESANETFQQIAFAYAILSDPRRRRRYDTTGSTAETLDHEDDDFNWMDFYREQFSSMVDTNAIEKIRNEYQGSEDERRDVLAAYEKYKGNMDRIHENVMLSNVLDDEERFRGIIDGAIADGTVRGWKSYTEESQRSKERRFKRARDEAREAEEVKSELDAKGKTKNGKKTANSQSGENGGGGGGGDDLAALIQKRQSSRAAEFFDRLEEKYQPKGSGKGKRGGGKKRPAESGEPPEEAFQANAAKMANGKKKRAKA